MNEEKISINLLGVCVLRDLFASHDDGGYQIKKFSNFTETSQNEDKKAKAKSCADAP